CAIAWMVPNFEEQLIDALTSKNQNAPVSILYDVVEQHYRKETLPSVSSFDRAKVLKRRLDLAFPSYPIRGALELKGAKIYQDKKAVRGEKKQPSYLFSAIPSSENLEKISAALLQSGVPVSRLSLLPVEGTSLVCKLIENKTAKGQK